MIDFYNYDLDAEIKKIKNIKEKSEDIDWYSSRKILHQLYNIPDKVNIDAYVYHGIYIPESELEDYALNYREPVLTTRIAQVEHLVNNGGNRKNIFCTGSLFLHYKDIHSIRQADDATGTIAYPAHSSPFVKAEIDWQEYIDKLNQLPDEFKPINICLYFQNILKGDHNIFIKNGFKVYCAGHANDPDFVDNFYEILKHHKYSTANECGSHILYSIGFGIPTFVYGRDTFKGYSGTERFKEAFTEGETEEARQKFQMDATTALEFFNKHIPVYPNLSVSEESMKQIRKKLGLDYQTPKKIVRKAIIDYAKEKRSQKKLKNIKEFFIKKTKDGDRRTIRFLGGIKIKYKKRKKVVKYSFDNYVGIQDFGADKNFYYGEIPQNDFLGILFRILNDKISAKNAITQYCQEFNNNYFLEHAISNKRGMCIELFEDLEGKKVLDYGCGLGAIGIEAIKKGAKVTFAEGCWPRLQMAKFLAEEISGDKTHEFLATSDILKIKETGEKYDLIIINGLLEWLPSTTNQTHETALQSQLNFLSQCRDLLTDEGRIFIGMENRFAHLYQIGYPEDHTEIKDVSFVNRSIGNIMHKEIKNTDYVNFTWTYEDYYKNAEKISLEVEKITGMFPDYRFVEKIIDLNNCDKQTLIEAKKLEEKIYPNASDYSEFIEYLADIDVLKHCVYSYGAILRKK